MQFLNPAGAWAFLALAFVVALYLLRQRAKRVRVPSLLLWRLAENRTEASRPFQKLKNQLLLWLQLLLAALLALALMRPASPGGFAGETALIFDLSASMQTETEGVSRLQQAKEAAFQILNGMGENDAVTVLVAGSDLSQPLSRSTDHAAARRLIEGLKAENGAADVSGAVALAQAMRRELPALNVAVLSDTYEGAPEGVAVFAVGSAMPNRSVRSLRLSEQEDGSLLVFAQLEQLGEEQQAELECYADGALCDVRTVTLPQNGTATVRFTAPVGTNGVEIRFAEGDALAADDARFAVRPVQAVGRALLVTEGNAFVEKALALRADLTVAKATPQDALGAEGFDLYVYDGTLPEALPQTGALLLLNPESAVLGIVPGEEKQSEGGYLRAGSSPLAGEISQHLLLSEIALRQYRPLAGGDAVLTLNGDPLLCCAEAEGRRLAVLGFDLHQSNLPLKADFPVLMQNLLSYLLPDAVSVTADGSCGDAVPLALDDRAVSAEVRTPTGRVLDVSGGALRDTDEIGLYTLTQHLEDDTRLTAAFALHVPPAESDTVTLGASVSGSAATAAPAGGREWTPWVLLLCLLVLLAEWEVSRRGA